MYQINRPLRIVKRDENVIIVNIPKAELQIEVNENVADFIKYLNLENFFDDEVVLKFAGENNISNIEDYNHIFQMMKELEVLIDV